MDNQPKQELEYLGGTVGHREKAEIPLHDPGPQGRPQHQYLQRFASMEKHPERKSVWPGRNDPTLPVQRQSVPRPKPQEATGKDPGGHGAQGRGGRPKMVPRTIDPG